MTARDRRALLLGAGVVLAAWVCLRGAPWIAERHEDLSLRVAARTALVERLQADLAQLPAFADSVSRMEEIVLRLPALVLPGDTVHARLELERRARQAVTDSAVAVLAYAPSHSDTTGPEPLVGLSAQLSIEGDLEGIASALGRIGADPTVWLDSIRLIGSHRQYTAAEPEVIQAQLWIGSWHVPSR